MTDLLFVIRAFTECKTLKEVLEMDIVLHQLCDIEIFAVVEYLVRALDIDTILYIINSPKYNILLKSLTYFGYEFDCVVKWLTEFDCGTTFEMMYSRRTWPVEAWLVNVIKKHNFSEEFYRFIFSEYPIIDKYQYNEKKYIAEFSEFPQADFVPTPVTPFSNTLLNLPTVGDEPKVNVDRLREKYSDVFALLGRPTR